MCVFFSFAMILMGDRRACCFTLIVFVMSCDCYCSAALPRDAVALSAGYNCNIL